MAQRPLPAVADPLALIPYAERFLEGRRVVIFGDATAGLAEEALERGARLVHVFDQDAARVAQAVATAERGVSFAVLGDAEASVRDGAFEVCLIPDLARFSDPRGLIALVRRITTSGALVVAATPRVDGRKGDSFKGRGGPLNYYDFYDVLARQFAAVQMVGQVPFRGYALVDFALEGDPEVSVDASLVDAADREPVAYVAFAGERKLQVEPYAIIQLPGEEVAEPARPAAPEPRPDEGARQKLEARLLEEQRRSAELSRALAEVSALPRQLELKLTEEAHRSEMLTGQLHRAQESADRALRDLRALQDRTQQAARTLAEAQAERAKFAQREEALQRKVRELEAVPPGIDPVRVDALQRRLEATERERAEIAQRLEATMQAGAEAVQRIEALMQERAQAAQQMSALRSQLTQAQRRMTELQAQAAQAVAQASQAVAQATAQAAAQAQAEHPDHVAELSAAEAALRERAREIASLRVEVERRGTMVRELLQALETREAAPLGPTPSLERGRLVDLEREVASLHDQLGQAATLVRRRDDELTAAQARIEALTGEKAALERAASERAKDVLAETQLTAARAEIEALRLALQQERTARASTDEHAHADQQAAAVLRSQTDPEPSP